MKSTLSEIMLRANTALFAQKVCKTMSDMVSAEFSIEARSLSKGFFCSKGSLSIMMHFAGIIQGDFIITTDENFAEIIVANVSRQANWQEDSRTEISNCFSEILNVSAGQTIPELEKKFKTLTLIPPYVVFGELRTANVASGNVDILSDKGTISCSLLINLASLRIINEETF